MEAAVKRVTGILRTNKIALENKVNVNIPVNHPIISWMTEYAAWMCTTMRVGDDGMTPYHRVRGRPYTKRLVQFGECVLAQGDTKGPAAQERGKLDSRWSPGVIVGFSNNSHAYWVHNDDGARLCRSVKRLPTADQWKKEELEKISTTRRSLHRPRGARPVELPDAPHRADDGGAVVERRRRAARRFDIKQKDLDPTMGGIGWTEGCVACSRARRYGWKDRASDHSDGCRTRVEDLLKQSESGKRRLELAQRRFDRRADEDAERLMRELGFDENGNPRTPRCRS